MKAASMKPQREKFHSAGVEPVLYDKNPYPGGHTASFAHPSGFVFDDGPHVSFTEDERLQELLAANVGGDFEAVRCRVNNYYRGHWIKHPAQCNLDAASCGLPRLASLRLVLRYGVFGGGR